MSDNDHVLLTDENKGVVAIIMGYSLATCEDILAKAKENGFKKVRLPIPPGR